MSCDKFRIKSYLIFLFMLLLALTSVCLFRIIPQTLLLGFSSPEHEILEDDLRLVIHNIVTDGSQNIHQLLFDLRF